MRGPSEEKFNEGEEAKALGLNYKMSTIATPAPSKEQVDTMMSAIEAARENPAKGSVLIHCAYGEDRTGCIIGIWRVSHDGWTYEDAYKEMLKNGFAPKYTEMAAAVKERVKSKDSATPEQTKDRKEPD